MATVETKIQPIEALERTFVVTMTAEEVEEALSDLTNARYRIGLGVHVVEPSAFETTLRNAFKASPPQSPFVEIQAAPKKVWKWFR